MKTPADTAAPRRVLAHMLALATAVQIVATTSALSLTALAPAASAGLGLGAYVIGYQVSAIYAAGMVSSALAGTLVSRHGPGRIEALALVCFTLGLLGLSSANLTLMLVATLAIGVGYGLNNPAASEMLAPVTPARLRNLVFSLKQSGVPLGGVVASVALPLVEPVLGWRGALAVAAAAPFLVLVWLCLGHRPAPRRPEGARPGFGRGILDEQSLIWRDAGLRALSLLGLLYSALQLAVSAFTVVTLVHDVGWSVIAAGSLAAFTQLAGALGRVGWGVVADRLGGAFRTMGLIGLISGLACLAIPFLADLPLSVQAMLFLTLGATSIGWNGVLLAAIARHAPAGRVAATTGAVLVYTFIGVIIGPSSFAALYLLFGDYGSAFAAFSVFGLAGAVLGFRTHSGGRRRES
ncbi:MFS transporter [Ensifer soli]|uniref:MFS transporter n=1 Tax=Ciceribacter sp. sgz301302 TaxID=3342379 RepID=UPI0035BA72C3